jgi:hypothetical protein
MSANNVSIGATAAVELASVPSRRNGVWSTTRRWRGLKSDLITIAESVDGEANFVEEQFPWWVLEITSAGLTGTAADPSPDPDDLVIELWAVQNEQVGLSIWDHASVRAEIAHLTNPVQRGFILQGMKTIASGQQYNFDTAGDGSGTPVVVSNTALKTIAIADGFSGTVYDQVMLDLAGQTPDIQWDFPVYTQQIVAPLASSRRAAYDIQNRMFSNAGFLAHFPNIPAVFKDNISSHLAGGYFRAGGVEGNQIDGATAQITQRFYYTPTIPSEFRWGSVLTS